VHVTNLPCRDGAPAPVRSPAPPAGSARASLLARGWLPDVGTLAERFVSQIHGIDEYRERSVPEESLREYATASMALLLHLIAGDPVPGQLAQVSANVGRDRARRGIPLEALVNALQLNFRVVWDALLERARPGDSAELLQCGPLIWEAVGTHLTRAVSGYQETVVEMARERQDSRRAAFAALVDSGGRDAEIVTAAAAVLSLDAAARFGVVVAAPGAEQALRTTADEVRARVANLYYQESPAGDVLVVQLPARLGELPAGWLRETGCAVGPVAHGLAEVPAALSLATAMTRLPRPGRGGPLRLRDAWLGLVALHSGAIMPLLVADVLGPLAEVPEAESERITEAVRVYLEGGSSVTQAAARLYCHRNTVVNRLRRFGDITGRDIRRADDAAVVLLALRARGQARQRLAGWLPERRPALDQQLVELGLDGVPDPVGQPPRRLRVPLPVLASPVGGHRGAELDDPVGRQRDRADRPEPREQRRDREVGQPQQLRHRLRVPDHRVDLLGAHDRARDDRHAGPQRGPGKAAAAKTLQPVPLAESLANSLEAFRENADELAGAEQSLGLCGVGQGMPALAGQLRDSRQRVNEIGSEQPQVPVLRMLVEHPGLQHQRVKRQHARVIRDDQRRTGPGHVLQAAHPDPEPLPVNRPVHRHQHPGVELWVEAVLVDLVIAGQAPPEELGGFVDPVPPAGRVAKPGLAHVPSLQRRRAARSGRYLLLIPALNARLPQQLAVLLLGHPLAALLDD
jgi:PucR C-terminal helix-turn-helix domain